MLETFQIILLNSTVVEIKIYSNFYEDLLIPLNFLFSDSTFHLQTLIWFPRWGTPAPSYF